MISCLSEGSPQFVGMAKSSDVWNWRTLLAVVRETLKGFPKVGSVMLEDERILPDVFYASESTDSTLFEIWLGYAQPINSNTGNDCDIPQ